MADKTHLRGFGSLNMTEERKHELRSRGGQANVNRYRWTPEEAARYGSIGGKISKRPPGKQTQKG